SASRISLLNWFIGKASVLIVFSDLIIRGRLSLFQFNLEIYTKYFTLPLVANRLPTFRKKITA
ncbi:MAG: hypothetical protein SPG57_08510, partial [Limosilactobacillus mucosae]